jgi:hypothetical protein
MIDDTMEKIAAMISTRVSHDLEMDAACSFYDGVREATETDDLPVRYEDVDHYADKVAKLVLESIRDDVHRIARNAISDAMRPE